MLLQRTVHREPSTPGIFTDRAVPLLLCYGYSSLLQADRSKMTGPLAVPDLTRQL